LPKAGHTLPPILARLRRRILGSRHRNRDYRAGNGKLPRRTETPGMNFCSFC
jgi:hypothetical protein